MTSWRPLTWFILVVQGLFIWWLIAGMSNVSQQSAECANQAYTDACKTGTAIGASIGIGMIIFLWALIDVILGVIWMVTNKTHLPKAPAGMYATKCARCGAGQNLPMGQAEYTCWQCHTSQHVGRSPAFVSGRCCPEYPYCGGHS
jgi:hypothetical protein